MNDESHGRLLAVVFAVVGVAVLYVGGTAAVSASQTDYRHGVTPATPTDVEEARELAAERETRMVFAFANLSADAQDAFLAAKRSPDGHATVHEVDGMPPALGYGDTGPSHVVVEYGGEYYEFTGSTPVFGGTFDAAPVVVGTVVVAGSALAASAVLVAGDRPHRSVTAFAASGPTAALFAVSPELHPGIAAVVLCWLAASAWALTGLFGWRADSVSA